MRRARHAAAFAGALLLAGCATTAAPPGTQVDEQRFAAATAPGATRASVLAALGPTSNIAFDSGYQVWLYQAPRAGGRFAEYVVLFDRAGLVSKTRRREPGPPTAN
jgi:outer membrane protein assembly factor BamE (lipoprotein component of BamABCDE complex)